MYSLYHRLLFYFAVIFALGFAFVSNISASDKASATLPRWTGDIDDIQKRKVLRALVSYSKTDYFLDGARERGFEYELLQQFEKFLNKREGSKTVKIKLLIIPVAKDDLIPALLEGRGDIAAAGLTITPERLTQVNFSKPYLQNVSEIVVTGPSSAPIKTVDDLAGREIYVLESSSYYASLVKLNQRFAEEGKSQMKLTPANGYLEDADILEMINAGLIEATIIDDHRARLWSKVFDKIKLHTDITVRTDGDIAWAIRKNNPGLKKEIDAFVATTRKGTLLGNMFFTRYLKENKWAQNAVSEKELAKLNPLIKLFRKYSDQYDLDWLMVAALAYQESRLDQSLRSSAGAIGVMQLLKTTAADPIVGIPNIENLENNIHAGAKYLHFIRQRYFDDPGISEYDKWFLTFAAYNAGPARVRQLRKKTAEIGLNPDRWYNNVEIAAARVIGRETVQYVGNITKYYLAYKRIGKIERIRERVTPEQVSAVYMANGR